MRSSILGVVGLLLVSGTALAQEAIPQGDQFPVNSYTTGRQALPAVAMDAQGNFVVAWESDGSDGSDPKSRSIQVQRYAANGTPIGGQFQVNSYTTGTQFAAEVAADTAGNFMVVWLGEGSYGTDDHNWSIHGQVFDSTGTPVGAELQVNTYTTSQQNNPQVAAFDDEGFVVVWSSAGGYGSDTSAHSIQAQRYETDGTPIGGQFQVNSYTTGFQSNAAVASFEDGGFVVVWSDDGSYDSDTDGKTVQGQRLDSDGDPVGGQFQVNTYTTSYQEFPNVAADSDGNFMVVWKSAGSSGTDTSAGSIQGQLYNAFGTPIGGEIQVNSYTWDNQERPRVAADDDGSFVVTWYGFAGDTDSDGSVEGQHYLANGAPIGEQFLVNSYTPGRQESPAIAAGDQIVMVWVGPDVNGRRFVSGLIIADGFESGDTSGWSSSVE